MAMLIRAAGRRRRPAPRPMADINVTPMVDVMLVLLIVFMITAPMLATGVAVNLPKIQAAQLPTEKKQPLMVTLNKEGQILCRHGGDAGRTRAARPPAQGDRASRISTSGSISAPTRTVASRHHAGPDAAAGAGFTNAALPVESKDLSGSDEILKNEPGQRAEAPGRPAQERSRCPRCGSAGFLSFAFTSASLSRR